MYGRQVTPGVAVTGYGDDLHCSWQSFEFVVESYIIPTHDLAHSSQVILLLAVQSLVRHDADPLLRSTRAEGVKLGKQMKAPVNLALAGLAAV